MTLNNSIGKKMTYSSVNPAFFHHKRIRLMTPVQQSIVLYTILSPSYCNSKRTGIYHISTTEFMPNITIDEIQDHLGRTDSEISLKLRNAAVSITREEKEHYQGNLNKFFSDVIEYDPNSDMVFSKLAFVFSGMEYLNTSKKMLEGIGQEYRATKHIVPERWWGEFMRINNKYIHEAWEEFAISKVKKKQKDKEGNDEEISSKEFTSLQKTFEHLFELEKQYTIFAKKITSEKLQKMKDFLEDKIEILSQQTDFFKTS